MRRGKILQLKALGFLAAARLAPFPFIRLPPKHIKKLNSKNELAARNVPKTGNRRPKNERHRLLLLLRVAVRLHHRRDRRRRHGEGGFRGGVLGGGEEGGGGCWWWWWWWWRGRGRGRGDDDDAVAEEGVVGVRSGRLELRRGWGRGLRGILRGRHRIGRRLLPPDRRWRRRRRGVRRGGEGGERGGGEGEEEGTRRCGIGGEAMRGVDRTAGSGFEIRVWLRWMMGNLFFFSLSLYLPNRINSVL